MVQIVEHHDFMPEDFPVEEEAASSTPRATNRPAPGAAVVHSARQHTPAQASRASRSMPGALFVARELLRHPPSSMASPGAMNQWRDDVDRLLGMAHSGSARPRPRSSQRQHEASALVRSPSVTLQNKPPYSNVYLAMYSYMRWKLLGSNACYVLQPISVELQ
jgi:hypothetical protein